jgi:hypothetical protein
MATQAAGLRPDQSQETTMTDAASVKDKTLSFDELDRVAGGIIIVGGLPQLSQRFTSPLDRVAINPQPLPSPILFGY